ncbi:MAG TPA: hypothetical protein VGD67_06260 [Pseudonocardiaceae bacterium]
MESAALHQHRARAGREGEKSAAAERRQRWEAALRHNRHAAEALERAVALADHDDDRLLLAEVLGTGARLRELSGDCRGAVSAARAALRMYETVDRDAADPSRIPRMLDWAATMGVHPRHGPFRARFEEIYARVADAHLTLARLIAEHEPTGGDEARRLASVALETYRALASAGDHHGAADVERVAAGHQAVLDRLSVTPGGAAEPARPTSRDREAREAGLRSRLNSADSLASAARDHYAARRFADAVLTMREAVGHYRAVADDSLWHKRELARALHDLAHHLEAHGDLAAAVDTMREAGVLFGQVLEHQDRRFAPEVAHCRRELRRLRLVRLRLRPRATRLPPLPT